MTETVPRAANGASRRGGADHGPARLRVERIHTTPGVHPYDAVTWERRDVVMTNWRDGSVNFEQRGVEFPDFWSQNAVNIVTTKYFRGALGTPTREWSLRQLVDRVTRAYVAAGRAHGYLATDEDAEVFEHELVHALIHQVFSFNSPVWFNVGTKSPQQVSACQPYEALVSTPGGLVPIGRLVEDDAVGTKVCDAGGVTRIVAAVANGVKDVLRLHTKPGYVLDVTADHVVWKSTGERSGCWVPAGELRPGDRLEWHRHDSHGEGEIDRRDAAEAALAGWLQSRRFVRRSANPDGAVTVELMTVTEAEFDWLVSAVGRVFPQPRPHECAVVDAGSAARRTVRLSGDRLESFLGRWALHTSRTARVVPTQLFTAPLPVAAAYLRSLFQTEGSASGRSRSSVIRLEMIPEGLARGIQNLLVRFGVFAKVSSMYDPRPHRSPCWSLRIGSAPDRRTFLDEVGVVDSRKQEQLEADFVGAGSRARTTERLEITRIEPRGPVGVYDIQTESGEYLCGGIRVHNCFILAVDDSMDSILDWYKEEGLIFKGGSGAGVNLSRIRSSKELLSSGGTASGPVSFMRGADASAGTIKSGGATRRAAKMVILDVDHPDIEEFVETKAREEDKIRALRDAGFDMDLGGRDIVSVQYQNANNSVRVSDEFMRAVEDGDPFSLYARRDGSVLSTLDARALFRRIARAAWECADPGVQYDDTINDWHTCPETGRITASNPCSEYMHLDNSSCNLASLNLMAFLRDDGTFDAARFAKVVELVITAMDISICFADFPTEKIAATTRAYRQLGIGYANLGALLMATGHAYDSDGGRALAAAITSLMTASAYKRSAELAAIVGPYDGYARNAEAHKRVTRKHAAANDDVRSVGADDLAVLRVATRAWKDAVELGERVGYRNAQASVLAPTGCLTADTLVTTDRGLVRLDAVGDAYGERWQHVDLAVSTDEGPRSATRFFVNGEEPTRRIVTAGGYAIQGTLTHRIKVVDPATGEWVWKRLADVVPGELVPVQLGTLVGQPRRVPLPELERVADALDRHLVVPDAVDSDLAEFVGFFMGSGTLHARGLRLCTPDRDFDVIARLRVLAKQLFHIEPVVTSADGYQEIILSSSRLAQWWRAAGLAKPSDAAGGGDAETGRIPAPILETNDPGVYAAFARGVFDSAGTVLAGLPAVSTSSRRFADELRTLLLVLGLPTTTRETVARGGGQRELQLRVRNSKHARTFLDRIGFLSARKSTLVVDHPAHRVGDPDRIHLPTAVWLELAPVGSPLRDLIRKAVVRGRGVSRDLANRLFALTADERLGHALGYVFEDVVANQDGGVQPTFDLSVPDNVTYVAGGFVSHNTIGLMMDCDTTGIEPDLALVKTKKLIGGASMQIVNRMVARALATLGYPQEQVEAIVDYVKEHGHVVDAPGLRPEHYEVFDCAMGERAIAPMGHVRMLSAVQPFLSGSASKTVNLPESATVEDIEDIYFQGWKLGLKALAVYRNNSKVGQPLSAKDRKAEVEKVVEYRPVRRRLPKKRPSETVSFAVGGAEGYLTAGSYPDDGLGELFIKMSKQGSTLAGTMDAFSIAVSIGLQYGVPLEAFVSKFVNMRFEPAGMTDDPDVRLAQSVMDYIFRRLALDFLPYETRAAYGIFTAQERAAAVSSGLYAAATAEEELDVEALRSSAPIEKAPPETEPPPGVAGGPPAPSPMPQTAVDAPLCFTCGVTMRPAGSCYVCEQCGATSGCS
ncbi:MAG TPA: adenosylcobalamin-dependent ribonucleoside-diphosphate reductase [Mycobacteriales bacterium]|nr:adenosylcobalamin-dependent ribonucleoside-diphosphate reductase [Mycobacteriales bacterium]